MTTKTLRGTYSAGYNLASQYSELVITKTAEVGGTGVSAGASATIFNEGTILSAEGAAGGPGYYSGRPGDDGMHLSVGSAVNGGVISAGQGGTAAYNTITHSGYSGGAGGQGILFSGAGRVVNRGAVFGGAGGLASHSPTGGEGAGGQGGSAMLLLGGGEVINRGHIAGGAGGGSSVFSGIGGYGVAIFGYGTVINEGGTIFGGDGGAGGGGQAANQSNGNTGILLASAGEVVNTGLIAGGQGGSAYAGSGRSGSYGGYGVDFKGGGAVTNTGTIAGGAGGAGGSSTGTGGSGGSGGRAVYYQSIISSMTSVNSGLIIGGAGGAGGAGGVGGAGGRGGDGFLLTYGYGYTDIRNRGAIVGGAGGRGGHGSAGNGNAGDGGDGVVLSNGATVVNFGTIAGGAAGSSTALRGDGIVLTAASTITNAQGGVISGQTGIDGGKVYALVVTTITNGGLIEGASYSVLFNGQSGNTLVARAGAAFIGEVDGGRGLKSGYFLQGGVFDLAGGVGTITGLGGKGVVSGAVTADFAGFGTYELNAAGRWTLAGSNALAAGQSLTIGGAATVTGALNEAKGASIIVQSGGVLILRGAGDALSGTLVNNGVLKTQGADVTISGGVTGSGAVVINAGILSFGAAFDQAVTFSGKTGTLELAHSRNFTATVTGLSANRAQSLDLGDIAFVGAGEATFSGTAAGGVLTVTDGTHTARINLNGDYRGDTFMSASDGHGGVSVTASPHAFAAAMAAMGGGRIGPTQATIDVWRGSNAILASPRLAVA